MRTRILLTVMGLVIGTFAAVGIANGQTGDTPAINQLVQAFRDAQVDGDRVVVSEPVPDNPILNPFGGDSLQPPDVQNMIRITDTFQVQTNPGAPYQFFEQDPMGVDIAQFPGPAGVVDVIDPVVPQGWTPVSQPGPLEWAEFMIGITGAPFTPEEVVEMWTTGQPLAMDGALVIPPAGGAEPPMNVPWTVRGARLASPLPDGWCLGGVLEFFSGDAVPGFPTWEAQDFAPNDSFDGLSQAHVTRCVNGEWQPTQLLVNNGSQFQPQGTFATTIVYPDTLIQLIPRTDVMASDGWRIGAFHTDYMNPYQPENSGFSTFPEYPTVAMQWPPPLLQDQLMPMYPTTPIGIGFSNGSEGTPDYDNNFGVVIDPNPVADEPIDVFKVDLIQFDTYQVSSGFLEYDADADDLKGTLEGTGDGYTESYDFTNQVYVHSALQTESFDFTDAAGIDWETLKTDMSVFLADREAAVAPETTTTLESTPTTIGDPSDDPADVGKELSDDGLDPILWLILLGIFLIILGLVLWFLFGMKKKDPCADLYAAWQKAKGACDKAMAEAKAKRAEADKAKTAREAAEKALKDHCKKYPPACGKQASVTDTATGRTITRDDIFVTRAWNAQAWGKYKGTPESAQETQDDWNNGPTKEFRDKTLNELKAAKAKTPDLETDVKNAKKAESDANAAADKAEAAAKKLCDEAAAAKKAYDDCVGAAAAGAAAGDAAAAGAAGAAAGGLAGAAIGAGAAGGGNCDPQQQAYDAAKKACDEAAAASKAADQEVGDAHEAVDDAREALEQLCEEYPPLCGEDAWIEESGKPETRIDRSDLFAHDLWSEQVWTDYQTDQIDAQDVQDRWEQGPTDDFVRDAKQKLKDAAPLKPAREQAIKDAEARLAKAEKAASDARKKAEEACAKADAAKKALDACLGSGK